MTFISFLLFFLSRRNLLKNFFFQRKSTVGMFTFFYKSYLPRNVNLHLMSISLDFAVANFNQVDLKLISRKLTFCHQHQVYPLTRLKS